MAALPIKEQVKPVKQIGKKTAIDKLPTIDLPLESEQHLSSEDQKILDAAVEKFGDRLDNVYYESLLRFIYGYAHEKERLKATLEHLEHYLNRFEEFHFDRILDSEMDDKDNCLKAWPVFMYGYDKHGHPVMYDEICSSTVEDVKKVFAPNGETDWNKIRQFRFRFLRRLEHNKFLQSERYGKNITKHIMIMDMKHFTHKHLYQQMRHLVADVIDDESNLFPDTLYRMFIVNAPFPFRVAWKIVCNFIHPITVEKIQILGPDYLKQVTKDIDINQLPPRYKGKGKWDVNFGYVADIENDIVNSFQKHATVKQVLSLKNGKNNTKNNEKNTKEDKMTKDKKNNMEDETKSEEISNGANKVTG